MTASAHDVAAYILARQGQMSTMKLQKLVYYAQAWHLVWAEEPLFGEKIEAWANGPVVKELFAAHRGRFTVDAWPLGDPTNLDKVQAGSVDATLETYGGLSGRKLSYLTHAERPWRDARYGYAPTELCHVEITPEALQDYYTAIADDPRAVPIEDFDWGSYEDIPAVSN